MFYIKVKEFHNVAITTIFMKFVPGLAFQEYSSCGPRVCHDRKGLAYTEVTLPETGATVLLIVTHMIAAVDRKCIVCVTQHVYINNNILCSMTFGIYKIKPQKNLSRDPTMKRYLVRLARYIDS